MKVTKEELDRAIRYDESILKLFNGHEKGTDSLDMLSEISSDEMVYLHESWVRKITTYHKLEQHLNILRELKIILYPSTKDSDLEHAFITNMSRSIEYDFLLVCLLRNLLPSKNGRTKP